MADSFLTLSFAAEVFATIFVIVLGYCFERYFLKKIHKIILYRTVSHFSLKRGFKPSRLVLILLYLIIAWMTLYALAHLGIKPFLFDKLTYVYTLWVFFHLTLRSFDKSHLTRLVATLLWGILSLAIFEWLSPLAKELKELAFHIGSFRLTALNILTGCISILFLLWFTSQVNNGLQKMLMKNNTINLTHKMLFSKFIRFTSFTIVAILGIQAMGIDLMALTVFTGAIGLGIGFGLQKVFSNLMSGIIILMDKSIKPGDVIAVEGTYGVVKKLDARYVSVVTRDGRKHLIPNETFITHSVENWSYLDREVRLRIPIGVSYEHDPRNVQEIIVKAALGFSDRVLKERPPTCRLMELGESALIFELRVWIKDPENGIRSATSDILIHVWEALKENNIKVPYPRRDIHILNNDLQSIDT
tara:strand:+ start:28 stop:1275 length:1248 start_codon:yes stop_codon:yes gene_type:complete